MFVSGVNTARLAMWVIWGSVTSGAPKKSYPLKKKFFWHFLQDVQFNWNFRRYFDWILNFNYESSAAVDGFVAYVVIFF